MKLSYGWRDKHVHNWLEFGTYCRTSSKTGEWSRESYLFWLWSWLKPLQRSWQLGNLTLWWMDWERREKQAYICLDSYYSDGRWWELCWVDVGSACEVRCTVCDICRVLKYQETEISRSDLDWAYFAKYNNFSWT